ncbi:MAG: ABC transporter permease [Actinomycetota bacterium]
MTVSAETIRGRVSVSRARGLGILMLALAAVALLFFGLRAEAGQRAVFGLGENAPDLGLPVQAAVWIVGGLLAFLGGIQLVRGFGRRTYVILGFAIGMFVLASLTYAARDQSLNLVSTLNSTLLRAVPLTLGAMSGVLCERSGVINIAIEGMFLTAAFTGSIVGSAAGSLWAGLLGGVVVGGILGWLLAVLSIRYRVDQIVAGTVINILALGLTSFLSARLLQQNQALNNPGRFQVIELPLLSDIPIAGSILFRNNVFVYLMFGLIALLAVALFRTRWGLRVRAVGEHPLAADTLGIRVLYERYRSVIFGGMMAGLGGAFFTLGSVGRFDENMTAGRGFIALAAMIFGRWHPVGAFGAALVFGFADSLQTKLAILGTGIPSEFLLMAPYLATILVVAGLVGRARPPAADGKPYVKAGGSGG